MSEKPAYTDKRSGISVFREGISAGDTFYEAERVGCVFIFRCGSPVLGWALGSGLTLVPVGLILALSQIGPWILGWALFAAGLGVLVAGFALKLSLRPRYEVVILLDLPREHAEAMCRPLYMHPIVKKELHKARLGFRTRTLLKTGDLDRAALLAKAIYGTLLAPRADQLRKKGMDAGE